MSGGADEARDEPRDERETGGREPDEPAPFATWRVIYGAVAALLVLQMVLFYWLSRRYG